MALSIADILTLVIAFITACIALFTYCVAKKSYETAREAVKFAKLQLNNDLCTKLYEFKDLTSDQGGRLLLSFFSNQVRDEEKELLYSIKDNARTLIQKKN